MAPALDWVIPGYGFNTGPDIMAAALNECPAKCDQGHHWESPMGFTLLLRCSQGLWKSGPLLCPQFRFSERAGSSTSFTCLIYQDKRGEQSPSVWIRVTGQGRAGNSARVSALPPQCSFLFISLPSRPGVSANWHILTTQLFLQGDSRFVTVTS